MPVNVCIALSKAFDTLTFDVLLFKLKYYGVTDTAIDLMRTYLTNNLYLIVVNLTIVKYILEYHGDPDLGPLLFSIYIKT